MTWNFGLILLDMIHFRHRRIKRKWRFQWNVLHNWVLFWRILRWRQHIFTCYLVQLEDETLGNDDISKELNWRTQSNSFHHNIS